MQQPGSSSSSNSNSSIMHGATPDAVDRVTVDRWLQTMESRHASSSPNGAVMGKAEIPPPAFVVLQLLG
jgi:hypothetical protein